MNKKQSKDEFELDKAIKELKHYEWGYEWKTRFTTILLLTCFWMITIALTVKILTWCLGA